MKCPVCKKEYDENKISNAEEIAYIRQYKMCVDCFMDTLQTEYDESDDFRYKQDEFIEENFGGYPARVDTDFD